MAERQYFKNNIFKVHSGYQFEDLAMELFRFQSSHNPVYKSYIENLGIDGNSIKEVNAIPFMPISFFKGNKVITDKAQPQIVFSSSGTTGSATSEHYVADTDHYKKTFKNIYRQFMGEPDEQCVLALLPSYLEREGSSLIYMVEELIATSSDKESGFFLNDLQSLSDILGRKQRDGKTTVLFGVTFALLDLAEKFPQDLSTVSIVETGGMKGRRKEMIREEVHATLKDAFEIQGISSEYGMTELLSQAYALENGKFKCPPWMKVYVRSINDPFSKLPAGKTGGINIIDLANVDSCAFIETQDLGRIDKDGSFEVMGRFDNSDVRGCNLMVI